MEEKRLRSHLIRIYCVTVAAVLFLALFAVAAMFLRDAEAQDRERFATLLFAVSDQLGQSDSVSHSGLRELERANRLLLSLGDNGSQLLYNSGDDETTRSLFARVQALAGRDGYDIAMLPLTRLRRTSPIYSFSENGSRCLGAVSILPLARGYRTVTMVQRAQGPGVGKLALLGAGYLLSVALLSVAGVRLIDRALLPALESRKRQARFIAAASHELRSPLAVMAASASTVRENPNAAAEATATIENECARMSRLISDMLLLASTDAKSWPVRLAAVETDTVLLNVYEAHAPLFQKNGCALVLTLPEEPLPRVLADGERLGEVLAILLDNALSHGVTPERRTVTLAAEVCGRGVSVTVADHGPGLTEEQKAQVFERFCRGDASRREKQHFGLGLSIARELIGLQNGLLAAEDTPGGGCTFRITLERPA